MIVRTVRSKELFRMAVLALCLTAEYSPVAFSQETKKDADQCRGSSDTASPCPSAAPEKEIAGQNPAKHPLEVGLTWNHSCMPC